MEFKLMLILLGALIIALLATLNLMFGYLEIVKTLKNKSEELTNRILLSMDIMPTLLHTAGVKETTGFYQSRAQAYQSRKKLTELWNSYQAVSASLTKLAPEVKDEKFRHVKISIHEDIHNYNEQVLIVQAKLEKPLFRLFNRYILKISNETHPLIETQ